MTFSTVGGTSTATSWSNRHPSLVVHERPGVDERPDELLEEERVALGGLEDPALHVGGQRAVADERVQQLAAGVARQRLERDLA